MVMKKYLLFIFILLSTIIFIGCNNQPEEPKLSISIIGPDEIYEFKIEVDPTTNPNTSDKFLIIAIIGLISILGFSKTTRRFKRKNALN